jgi:molecular chaperone GrpE (heat shock protein)
VAEPVDPTPEASSTAASKAAGARPEVESFPDDPLQAAQAERDALMQKWLIAVADLDNYRRRVAQQRAAHGQTSILARRANR